MRKVRAKHIHVNVYFPRGTLPEIHEDDPYLEITSDDNITIVAEVGAPSVRKFRDHGGDVALIGYLTRGADGELEVAHAGLNFLGADGAPLPRPSRPRPGGPGRRRSRD